jgi:hypothetical protein
MEAKTLPFSAGADIGSSREGQELPDLRDVCPDRTSLRGTSRLLA